MLAKRYGMAFRGRILSRSLVISVMEQPICLQCKPQWRPNMPPKTPHDQNDMPTADILPWTAPELELLGDSTDIATGNGFSTDGNFFAQAS